MKKKNKIISDHVEMTMLYNYEIKKFFSEYLKECNLDYMLGCTNVYDLVEEFNKKFKTNINPHNYKNAYFAMIEKLKFLTNLKNL